MPSRINGCGTGYYGKKNVRKYKSVCQSCKKEVTMRSYDTTEYFCMFFIPLIPLHKKHIIDHCPACTRHFALDQEKHAKAKQETYENALARLRENPEDAEAAEEIIRACLSFRDREGFARMAPEIIVTFQGNQKILNLVGDVYENFGLFKESENAYRVSMEVEASHEAREGLALALIRQVQPEAAAPQLAHIFEEEIPDRVPYLALLVKAYQQTGKHQQALETLDRIAAIVPGVEKDKDYRKTRKASEKRLATGKPIAAKDLQTSRFDFTEGKNTGGKVAKAIGPAILIILAAVYLFAAFSTGRSRTVIVVNGLDRAYEAQIGGQAVQIPAGRPIGLKLAEGDVKVVVPDEQLEIPERTVSIRSNFWTRPFAKRTFIINPDRTAVLYWSKFYYAPPEKTAPEPEEEILGLEPFYEFSGIDYAFEKPPDQISMSSSKPESRRRVDFLSAMGIDPIFQWEVLSAAWEKEMFRNFLIERIKHSSNAAVELGYLMKDAKVDDSIDFLRSLLDKTPARVDAHRTYQTLMERERPEYDLAGEYQDRLEKNPADPDLQYLSARLLHDPREYEQRIRPLAEAAEPSMNAVRAYARFLSGQGRFEEALPYARLSFQDNPEAIEAYLTYQEMLVANRRYDEAIKLIAQKARSSDSGFIYLGQAVPLAIAAGREDDAAELVSRAAQQALSVLGPDGSTRIENASKALLAYARGDRQAFVEQLKDSEDPNDVFRREITAGHAGSAYEAIKEIEDPEWKFYLISYIACSREGLDAEARECLDSVVNELSGESWEGRQFAAALKGESELPARRIAELSYSADDKRLLLTALGLIDPGNRGVYWPLAEKLNFQPAFPALLIDSVIDEAGALPAGAESQTAPAVE